MGMEQNEPMRQRRAALRSILKDAFPDRGQFSAAFGRIGLAPGRRYRMAVLECGGPGETCECGRLAEALDARWGKMAHGAAALHVWLPMGARLVLLAEAEAWRSMSGTLCDLCDAMGLLCRIGAGEPFDRAEYLGISYREALEACAQGKADGTSGRNAERARDSRRRLDGFAGAIVRAMEAGRYEDVREAVEPFFTELSRIDPGSALEACMGAIRRILEYFGTGEAEPFEVKYRFDLFGPTDAEMMNAVKATFLDNIVRIIDAVRAARDCAAADAVRRARQIVRLEFARPDLTLLGISQRLNVSYGYLSKLFKKKTGESFHRYLSSVRMSRAKRLLSCSSRPVREVACAVGFDDPGYFATAFRRRYGVPPGEYREFAGTGGRRGG